MHTISTRSPNLPWTRLGKKLESMLRKAIFDFQLLHEVDSLSIALSGGKDSLTLLYLLNAIRDRGFPNFTIHALHVSGDFTCGAGVNEHYLKNLCQELNIPLHILTSTQKLQTLECYSCSRERRKLLFNKAREINAPTIAFGHHRDDSAQTLLMNLLHKAEFATMLPKVPMQEYGVTIIRPLIYISENEIREFAKLHGFARITCQCPVGVDSMRKQVDKILDHLEPLFPNARANIAQAGLHFGSKKALIP